MHRKKNNQMYPVIDLKTESVNLFINTTLNSQKHNKE